MAVHRNRVIYQSEALFISPDSTGYHFTGAKTNIPIEGVGSGPFGLATPPLNGTQVFGGTVDSPALTNNGQLAGWTQGQEWPEWNPLGKTSSSLASYNGTADVDNHVENYDLIAPEVGVAFNQNLVGDGTSSFAGLIAAIGGGIGYFFNAGDENLKPDNAAPIAIAGGVDHQAPSLTFSGLTLTGKVDNTDPSGATAAQDLHIEFIDTAGSAINISLTATAGGDPLLSVIYDSIIMSDRFVALGINNDLIAQDLLEPIVLPSSPAPAVAGGLIQTALSGGVNGSFASFTAGVPVESSLVGVSLVADFAGSAGNVEFTGDDTKTIDVLVNEHNAANPSNTITVNTGGSSVLNTGAKVKLAGGTDGYAKAHGTIIKQLERVQGANYGFTVNRQDINQFGHAARLDSIVVESPTVNLDFSYYLVDGYNERLLEFVTDGEVNTLSGALSPEIYQAGNNFFILTAVEARDAVNGDVNLYNEGKENQKSVISLGNGYITDYSIDISVGSIPTASVTVEGMNIKSDLGTTGNDVPAMDMKDGSKISNAWNKDENGNRVVKGSNGCTGLYSLPATVSGYDGCGIDVAALRPGDVVVNLQNASLMHKAVSGAKNQPLVGSAHVQSASISIPMGRTTLQRLGSTFGFSKALDLPLTITMSVSALVADMKEDNLIDFLCSCDEYNISLDIFDPQCDDCVVKAGTKAMGFTLKGARLESESYSSSIGDNKTVDLTFTTQIGGADDIHNGLFIYGKESQKGNKGLPPAWTGLNGSTEEAVSGYLFGYRE